MPGCPPKLSPRQVAAAKAYYETSGPDVSYASTAAAFGVSRSTMEKLGAKGKWVKNSQLLPANGGEIMQGAIAEAFQVEAQTAAKAIAKRAIDGLEPWIEKQKARQIRRSVLRAVKAQKRIDKLAKDGYSVVNKEGEIEKLDLAPKDESFIAGAEDKYDGIIRRNLGMSESASVGGSLSLRMLTQGGTTAVEATVTPNK